MPKRVRDQRLPNRLLPIMVRLLTLLALVIVTSCERGTVGHPLTYVEGTVTDSLSGLPLDSVAVYWQDTLVDTITGWPRYTDSAGHFEVDFFGYRQGVFYFLKSGYKTQQISIHATESRNEFTNQIILMSQGTGKQ